MVTDWFAGKLFLGMAIFIIGWPVYRRRSATQARLAELHGWNFVFILTAIMMAIALGMTVFYRNAPASAAVSASQTARLTRDEFWLVCIAGAIWMLINGAYVVMLSFGPTLVLESGASVTDAAEAVSAMSWVFLFALPLGGWLSTRYMATDMVESSGLSISDFGLHTFRAALLTFALFGSPLPSPRPRLLPSSRNPATRQSALGFRDLYVWYYAGPLLPPMGGLQRFHRHRD